MFNEYMWKTYLNAGGKDVVKMFEDNLGFEMKPDFFEFIAKLHKSICAAPIVSNRVCKDIKELYEDLHSGSFFIWLLFYN